MNQEQTSTEQAVEVQTAPEAITLERLQGLASAANTLHALLTWDLATVVPHANNRGLTVELKLITGEQRQPMLWLPSIKFEAFISSLIAETIQVLDSAGIDTAKTLADYKEAAIKNLNSATNQSPT